ncbi:MAG: hypothetical protein A2068_11150, partial [Ignavibacteria bacterium GWB2_35_6b]
TTAGNANVANYGADIGGFNKVCQASGASNMTLTFDASIKVTTIRAATLTLQADKNWTFTPSPLGSNTAKTELVDGLNGTTVTLNFIDITSISITQSSVNEGFVFDNLEMDASLPVELTTFLSILTLNSVKLKWETATEVNNYGFDVERSAVSVQQSDKESVWEKIGFVEGHGNSNSPKKYVYEDKTFAAGKIYQYRLKQIDFDGAFEYSDELIVETTVPEKAELAQNYPNPFNPSTTIKFSMPEADFANLTVYNSIGEKVAVLINENLEAGFYTYLFDGSKLASGAYVYKLEAAGRVITKKMLLVK